MCLDQPASRIGSQAGWARGRGRGEAEAEAEGEVEGEVEGEGPFEGLASMGVQPAPPEGSPPGGASISFHVHRA